MYYAEESSSHRVVVIGVNSYHLVIRPAAVEIIIELVTFFHSCGANSSVKGKGIMPPDKAQ